MTLRRRATALALAIGVTLLQLWALRQADSRLGRGAADDRPRRLDVTFVRVLQPASPLAVAPPTPVPPAVPPALAQRPVRAVSEAASAPAAPPPAPTDFGVDWLAELQAQAAASAASAAATAATAAAVAAVADAADAASTAPAAAVAPPVVATAPDATPAPAFAWPPSTRLRYRLTGYYRGAMEGDAQVEWLRDGTRYQVHLDVTIGAPFAPLITRQMSSDGELGPDGLRPRRYDERTRVLFSEPYRARIDFEPDAVVLPRGRRVPRPAGVQDSVSQFVQLTWHFTLHPEDLVTGRRVPLPLALPRRVDTWVYEVQQAETLHTPAGPVEAVHVRPLRQPRPGGDLVAEVWFAPSLQYLPVRLLIRQDAETFIDLLVDRLPEQALPPAPR